MSFLRSARGDVLPLALVGSTIRFSLWFCCRLAVLPRRARCRYSYSQQRTVWLGAMARSGGSSWLQISRLC